jgi:hypothetical protein
VRAAIDDCDSEKESGSLDVTLTINGDIDELRRRAHALIENAGYDGGVTTGAAFRHPAGGVRIHVTPVRPNDLENLRDEIEARIDRASDPSRCQ